jgi:protein involved in polysaccharide export with SLBB domain
MSEVKTDKLSPVTSTTTTFGDSGDKLLFTTGTNLDMNGVELILDADADTSITADTDDQIDIKIAGADDFQFTANKFLVQTGSNIDMNGTELILDADADTSITADTDDQIDIKIAGADDFRFTANTFSVLSGSTLNIDSGATIANSGTATGFADFTAIGDGSVGSPSLANSGDTNTGIYWPGADQLGLTTAGAAGMLIDASGRVTTPLQPMFRAQRSNYIANVTGDGTVFTVPFNEEIGGDVGGNYNLATATFTAPVAGYYLFSVCVPYRGVTSSVTVIATHLVLSHTTNLTLQYTNGAETHINSYIMMASACVVHMTAAATAHVTMTASGTSKVVDLDYVYNSHFGGFLIG